MFTLTTEHFTPDEVRIDTLAVTRNIALLSMTEGRSHQVRVGGI